MARASSTLLVAAASLRALAKDPAVWASGASAAPHVPTRVALCLAGQARTFNASGVHENIYETMVAPLRGAGVAVDVFLALDRESRKGFDYKARPLAPAVRRLLQPASVVWHTIDQASPPADLCASYCGAYGLGCKGVSQTAHQTACLGSIKRREKREGRPYDWVLLARPDAILARALAFDSLATAAATAASFPKGVVFARPGRCQTATYCRSDTWVLASRPAADAYVLAHAEEFRRTTSCAAARREIVDALAPEGAKVHVHKEEAYATVCVECKLYHTVRRAGVAVCGAIADDAIVRQNRLAADGGVEGVDPLARRPPVFFEAPGADGRCGANESELLAMAQTMRPAVRASNR
mmetsp:Transcript_31636/g.97661  ORF Transcript_31636/g.97661 Transcript_31636/m.97661 type:complete len:354 (+) Transcript_31636:154-1215(+)